MILHEIHRAKMYEKIGPALDEMFGEHFSALCSKYRPTTMRLSMLRPEAAVSSGEAKVLAPPAATRARRKNGKKGD